MHYNLCTEHLAGSKYYAILIASSLPQGGSSRSSFQCRDDSPPEIEIWVPPALESRSQSHADHMGEGKFEGLQLFLHRIPRYWKQLKGRDTLLKRHVQGTWQLRQCPKQLATSTCLFMQIPEYLVVFVFSFRLWILFKHHTAVELRLPAQKV